MSLRKRLLAGVLASSMALSGGAAFAQDSTPMASPQASPVAERGEITLVSPEGDPVAVATFSETDEGLTITVTNEGDSGLEPGEHGIHIHEFGMCTPVEGDEPFSDAGDHFDPMGQPHGGPEDEESHAGDLGNLTVADDGSIDFEITTDRLTMIPGEEHSLADADGSSILIHANPDDLETDPAGESGDRVACGTIFQHPLAMEGTPVATPVELETEDAEATPAN
jgi:superoxide dismutase, Cu-Zn family